jgi:hypothetical protein
MEGAKHYHNCFNKAELELWRNHCATILESNRTRVEIWNDSIQPAFACMRIVLGCLSRLKLC